MLLPDGVEDREPVLSEDQFHQALRVEMKIGEHTIARDLFEDLTTNDLTDPNEVLNLLDRSVAQFAYWGTFTNELEAELDLKKLDRDLWYAQQIPFAREELSEDKPKSFVVTDAAIRNWVIRNHTRTWTRYEEEVIELEKKFKQTKAFTTAWDRRITALQSISKAQIALWERSR